MKKSRQIRQRKLRRKRPLVEIDITSLLDILVVILIFLLKSYSTSNVIINIPKEIELPRSRSQNTNQDGVKLQVSGDKIFVDDQKVADIQTTPNLLGSNGLTLIPLYNELVRKREKTERLVKTVARASTFNGMVNLVMDRHVDYNFLRKLMFTCGEAGYSQFKFVVLPEGE